MIVLKVEVGIRNTTYIWPILTSKNGVECLREKVSKVHDWKATKIMWAVVSISTCSLQLECPHCASMTTLNEWISVLASSAVPIRWCFTWYRHSTALLIISVWTVLISVANAHHRHGRSAVAVEHVLSRFLDGRKSSWFRIEARVEYMLCHAISLC